MQNKASSLCLCHYTSQTWRGFMPFIDLWLFQIVQDIISLSWGVYLVPCIGDLGLDSSSFWSSNTILDSYELSSIVCLILCSLHHRKQSCFIFLSDSSSCIATSSSSILGFTWSEWVNKSCCYYSKVFYYFGKAFNSRQLVNSSFNVRNREWIGTYFVVYSFFCNRTHIRFS